MSVAEMSEHHVTYVSAGFDKVLLALVLGCYGLVQRGTGGPDHSPSRKNHKNLGFLSNADPDPLKNHKATKPAFDFEP